MVLNPIFLILPRQESRGWQAPAGRRTLSTARTAPAGGRAVLPGRAYSSTRSVVPSSTRPGLEVSAAATASTTTASTTAMW